MKNKKELQVIQDEQEPFYFYVLYKGEYDHQFDDGMQELSILAYGKTEVEALTNALNDLIVLSKKCEETFREIGKLISHNGRFDNMSDDLTIETKKVPIPCEDEPDMFTGFDCVLFDPKTKKFDRFYR